MKRYLMTAATAALLMGAGPGAEAGGIPTIDPAAITQLAEQSKKLQAEYEQLIAQYDLLQKQFEATTGQSSFDVLGDLPAFDLDLGSQDLLGMVEGVQSGSLDGALGATAQAMLTNFGIENLAETAASELPATRAAAQHAGVATGAIALGEAGLAQAVTVEERAEALRDQAGGQETLKEAVDYNTLVLTEIARNQSRILSLLSAQLVNAGTTELSAVRASAAKSDFLQTNLND